MKLEPLEIGKLVMQWIVLPVSGFVWLIYRTQQSQQTEIAVLKALHLANKESHDREFKEVKDSFKAVLTKLEGIEQHLRK